MALTKKIAMQGDVFEGISSVFAIAGGITTTAGTSGDAGKQVANLTSLDILEFPVSDDSGFNFDSGQPSIERFKVKGLNADWVNTFTPGDGEITLEIPCHNTNILELVYGKTSQNVKFTVASGLMGTNTTLAGKGYSFDQKAIYLGLLILNDTEDKLLYIKKAKFMAQTIFDGSNKPLCVVLTGSISAAGDSDAFGILEPSD